MYADYTYYTTTYLGSALTEEEFVRAATRASSFLGSIIVRNHAKRCAYNRYKSRILAQFVNLKVTCEKALYCLCRAPNVRQKGKHGKANSRPRMVLLPRLQAKVIPGQRRCNVQGRIRSM